MGIEKRRRVDEFRNYRYDDVYSIGPIQSKNRAGILNFSLAGCPYRGSTTCLVCPLAEQIGKECMYQCVEWNRTKREHENCECFDTCPCSKDQTNYLVRQNLIEPES